MLKELQGLRTPAQIRNRILQKSQTEEKQRKAHHEFAVILPRTFFGNRQDEAHCHERNGQYRYVGLEPEKGYEPCGNRRSYVGPHYDTHSLGKRKETGIHETNYHYGSSTRGLNQGCNQKSGNYAFERVGCHGCEYGAHLVSGSLLEAFTHEGHSVKEHSQSSEQCQDL